MWGERISQDDAALVANHFMNATPHAAVSGAHKAPAKRMVLKKVQATTEEQQFYIYENADGEGWVMVAANDIAKPILAYSHEGYFRTDNQPANVKCWLGKYNKQIKQAEENGAQATEEVKQAWKQLRKGSKIRKATTIVEPLIKTGWNQNAPYWNDCPKEGNKNTYTGCVATAMAQVMNYWQWPNTGEGTNSIEFNSTTYTVDFSNGNYDWNNMLNKYTNSSSSTKKAAVAKLMYHCGVAAGMEYGTNGSGAMTINWKDENESCAQNALWKYFKYKKTTIKGYFRNGWSGYYTAQTDAQWKKLLKDELDAGRPILYGGDDNGTPTASGHSFVCDGYDSDEKFHFNWGWANSCDGFYDIDNLVPDEPGMGGGNGDYSYNQDIIIGIEPDKPDINITWSVQGVTSTTTQPTGTLVLPATTPSDCSGSGGKKFVGWTAQSSISGGAKPSDLFTSGTGITVTENKTYYAVFATASGSGGSGGTVTITTSTTNIPTSYGSANTFTEYTLEGYKFKIQQMYLNSGKLQWRASGHNNGTGTMYNNEAFPGKITSIVLTYNSSDGNKNFTVKVGDAVNPTSGTSITPSISGNVYTFDCSSENADYFVLTNGSGAGYLDKIVINYGGSTSYSDYSLECMTTPPATTYTVTWKACGETFKTETYAEGDALVLPTPAPSANAGKNFYGWTTTEHYTGDAAPALISAGSEVNADAIYYAVFH